MKVLKGYLFRLYPNVEQKILINKTIGSARLSLFLYPFIFTHFNLGSLINLFSKSSSIELYTFSL